MKKFGAYEMELPKGRIVLIGELSKGDVAFIRKWLLRIEAAQQTLAQPTDGTLPANEDLSTPENESAIEASPTPTIGGQSQPLDAS